MSGLTTVMNKAGRAMMRCRPIAKAMRKINRNKPEILAIGGGIAIIGAFGWAIWEAATMKDTLEETSAKVKAVEETQAAALAEEGISEEKKTEIIKAGKKDLTTARIEGAWVIGKKLIGPAALLALGMSMGTNGFRILRTRNIVLGGALKSTTDLMNFYRENVRADLGEEADRKYLRGVIGEKTIEEKITDENGREKTVKTTLPIVKSTGGNPWRFEFSENWFWSWQEDAELNLFFLKCEEDWQNHELKRAGSLSMYEVLKHLRFKFDVMKAGMSKKEFSDWMTFIRNHGWWIGSNGDQFVDLGIYRAINEAAISRQSDVIYIEMNCDGNLMDI